MYEDSECTVLDEGKESGWFKVNTGVVKQGDMVEQGDVMSGFIFLVVVDRLMRNTTEGSSTGGIRWKFTSKREDLDFADDIVLLSSIHQHNTKHGGEHFFFASKTGLRISKKKPKSYSRINNSIQIEGHELYKYS